MDLVSASATMAIDWLGLPAAFGLHYYDTEVIAALRTRSGKVYV